MFDVDKVRADFPILKRKIHGHDLVYLDSGATSQKPESVIKAMDDYYRNTNANIHRGVYELSVESTRLVDEARKKVADFIGARTEEVIFTRNASESLNLVMYSWGRDNIKKEDAVLISKLEHHSNLVPWQELCRETGAELRIIDVDGEGKLVMRTQELKNSRTQDEVLTENGLKVRLGGFEGLIADGKVKLFAVTGASNVLGTIPDLAGMLTAIKRKAQNATVVVDASQMVPHMKVDVKTLGADFIAFSGHKMLGPTGTGVLWGKKEVLSKMRPFLFGGDMIGEVIITGATWADLPSRFEAGTPDIAGIIGLGAAVDYLEGLGMDNVRHHEKDLMVYALKKMVELQDEELVTVYGPKDVEERGGALAFNVIGVHPHDAAQILDNFGIAVRSGQHCAAPLVTGFGVPAMVRATFYVYNTKKEIDYLVDKIREIPKIFT
ncbi:TPA: cysteine desulfurase [Candidatus Collierbacteria bacterium]|nr:MAG: Cysteine desulfurase [Candidatus Collierbacteria bacterium GW2011_GWA2_44_13]KKT61372.1 MAG: Cysteine desulfurase [Candidatus Collierbacteria bacterium GW2011_GWD1_44_27]KKT65331.1 MAG: Cysteine desulfurase [Candidatus Collierbacteria bacterium GW2011_GWC2_44_30]KKT88375.1 MAG: Cysteine desulfurase [Candidatus Collierbacteria bacterium GW2011_GWD2_45_10]HCQ31069.1 cysteine desulfurase [Candidatus Collierbacteria bacterium]